jgi:hypothetical protein
MLDRMIREIKILPAVQLFEEHADMHRLGILCIFTVSPSVYLELYFSTGNPLIRHRLRLAFDSSESVAARVSGVGLTARFLCEVHGMVLHGKLK